MPPPPLALLWAASCLALATSHTTPPNAPLSDPSSRFTQWLPQAGVRLSPDVQIRDDGPATGLVGRRGVFAVGALRTGTEVLRVPREAMINIEHAVVDSVFGPFLEEHTQIPDLMAMALFVLYLQRQPVAAAASTTADAAVDAAVDAAGAGAGAASATATAAATNAAAAASTPATTEPAQHPWATKWRAYLDWILVPSARVESPVAPRWTDDDLSWLQAPSTTLAQASSLRRHLKDGVWAELMGGARGGGNAETNTAHPTTDKAAVPHAASPAAAAALAGVDFDLFTSAVLAVQSRVHGVDVRGDDGQWHHTTCLVPGADAFNMADTHRGENTACWSEGGLSPYFVCSTTRDLPAGAELLVAYGGRHGRLSQAQLLLDYGFTIDYIPTQEEQDGGEGGGADADTHAHMHIVATAVDVRGLPLSDRASVEKAARDMVAREAAWDAARRRRGAKAGRAGDDNHGGEERPVGWALAGLEGAILDKLGSFPTTAAEDVELLTQHRVGGSVGDGGGQAPTSRICSSSGSSSGSGSSGSGGSGSSGSSAEVTGTRCQRRVSSVRVRLAEKLTLLRAARIVKRLRRTEQDKGEQGARDEL